MLCDDKYSSEDSIVMLRLNAEGNFHVDSNNVSYVRQGSLYKPFSEITET